MIVLRKRPKTEILKEGLIGVSATNYAYKYVSRIAIQRTRVST